MSSKKITPSISATKFRLFLLIWSFACSLTVIAYFFTDNYYKEKLILRTETLIEQAVELVKTRFEKYEYGLLSTRGAILLAENSETSRKHFEQYISSLNLSKDFPGARGFGFIRRVPVDQESDFVLAARADGAPNFNVKTLTNELKNFSINKSSIWSRRTSK